MTDREREATVKRLLKDQEFLDAWAGLGKQNHVDFLEMEDDFQKQVAKGEDFQAGETGKP